MLRLSLKSSWSLSHWDGKRSLIYHTKKWRNERQVIFHCQDEMDEHVDPQTPLKPYQEAFSVIWRNFGR
jgi:hypothetical protein